MDSLSHAKRKRKSLTIQQKMEILNKLEKGTKNKEICEEYQVNSSTVSTIFKNKDDITKFCSELENNQGDPKKRKINNGAELKILDEAVYLWLRQERALGKLVSGILLQEKARNLFILLKQKGKIPNESSDFKASSGWLRNFYHRHGIRNLQVKGEKASADKNASDAFIEEFRQLLVENQYSLDDVYNADETGLLYRCLPNRTLVLSDEKEVAGHKPIKDRLTVMVCANASGSHKIPPLVIGKSKSPRCFKNKTIPLDYTAQRKAWMDSNGFWFWYRNIFLKNVREIKPNAKIILLLDNAPTHPTAQELNLEDENWKDEDWKVGFYLPARVTSLIQPMDQGVISAMKRHYQTAFVRELLSRQLDNSLAVLKFVHTWDVLSCITLLKEAWDSLTVNTLRNAWKKLIPIPASDSIEEDSPTNSEIAQLLNCVPEGNAVSPTEVNDWLNADQHLPVFEDLNDEQIVQSVIGHPQSTENNEGFEAEENSLNSNITENENEEETKEQPTPQHVLYAAQCTLSYAREENILSGSELSILLKVRDHVLGSVLNL